MCHTTFYMLLRKTKKDANAKLGIREVKQYQGLIVVKQRGEA
jgi:hypothetical protein